jgi:hypothetical protein
MFILATTSSIRYGYDFIQMPEIAFKRAQPSDLMNRLQYIAAQEGME